VAKQRPTAITSDSFHEEIGNPKSTEQVLSSTFFLQKASRNKNTRWSRGKQEREIKGYEIKRKEDTFPLEVTNIYPNLN
jgi:hypothetical protein